MTHGAERGVILNSLRKKKLLGHKNQCRIIEDHLDRMDRMCRLGMSLFDQQQKAMQLESILCCSL